MGQYSKFPKLQIEDLGTEGTGDRIGLFDELGKLVGYTPKENLINSGLKYTKILSNYVTLNNTTTANNIIDGVIPANSLANIGDEIQVVCVLNCLVAWSKIDYTVSLGGTNIGSILQVGYDLNEAEKLTLKLIRADDDLIKVIASSINSNGKAFYYESSSFDFTVDTLIKIQMYNPVADSISFKFGEAILINK